MAAAASYLVVDFTSDRESEEDFRASSPSLKRARRSDNPLVSNHPPHTSPGRLTNHNASVTSSAPLPIEVEELNLSIRTTPLASLQLPKSLSDNAPDLLIEELVSMLRRFFHILFGNRFGGFSVTPFELACQL